MVDTPGSNSYREKYRQALDEQERMEKQFAFQLDALKKTLTHVGAAAQGLDTQLDAALIGLRDKMRGASGAQVLEQLERVQHAAADFEHSRHASSINQAKQLSALTNQLAELKVPKSLQETLESFGAGLRKRLASPRNYTDVFDELGKLQQLALEAAANPPTTFWQRLKGGKTLKGEEDEVAELSSKGASTASTPVAAGEAETIDDAEFEIMPADAQDGIAHEGEFIGSQEGAEGGGSEFDPGDEESYEKVAKRIAKTLRGLVERIEPNDIVRHKVDIVRSRIERGMDWYVLAVTLEDIRDILLLRYLQNDHEFSEYLKGVNSELKSISEALGLALEVEGSSKLAGDNFSSAVSDEVERMRDSVKNSGDIDGLKRAVVDHISAIQGALGDYRQADDDRETTLTEQLKLLVERVQSVESESVKTKELLEEERYRATHDVLTGLPNREAYNERAYQELQRYKRYCRPLTLAVCDVDHFKNINDTFGHQAGDKVLKLLAKLVATRLRKVDFVARYGGEEFVILMPETSPAQAFKVLDKIRAVIGGTPFRFKNKPVQITISFGLADFGAEDSVESVFERADKALYQAKHQGRNRCIIADQDSTEKTDSGESSSTEAASKDDSTDENSDQEDAENP